MASDSKLLAKQHPETTAALLRQLSRLQLKLWQDVGRKGVAVEDLELKYPRRDMIEELRFLEAHGVVILEVPKPARHETQSEHIFFDEDEDPLVERTMEASPLHSIPTPPPPAQAPPAQPVPAQPVPASAPPEPAPSAESIQTATLSQWADERTTEDKPLTPPPKFDTSPLQQWADERTDEDAPLQTDTLGVSTSPLHGISTPVPPGQPSKQFQPTPAAGNFQPSPSPQSSAPIELPEPEAPQSAASGSIQAAPSGEIELPAASVMVSAVASSAELPNITPEEQKLLAQPIDLKDEIKIRILQVARAVENGDITGLLGLPTTAKRKEIKRAYFKLSKELHPDQYFGRNLGEFQPLLEQVFGSLSQYVKALNDKRTTLPSSYRASNQSRRQSQRFHLQLKTQFQCDSWTEPQWATTQDVSEGGVFLMTESAASVGEPVRLNLESPNGLIGMVGKIVSICDPDQARRQRRNSGFGIRFEGASHIDYQRLKDLLKRAKEVTPAFTAAMPVKSEAAQRMARGSKAAHRKEHIIGIDLGTTNTAVSAVIDNRVQIVPWPGGTYSMPSVIAFPERGKAVIGFEAQKHLIKDPRLVMNSAKRLVGRQLDDPAIASYMAEARFAHEKGPDGSVIAKFWGEPYAIPQVVSYLFEGARKAATETLGKEPTKAVLTIPVSFEHKQIESMRKAARLAQLEVVEVIEEPCSAAIANQGQRDFSGIVGVYDFGGGTFDFSLVEAGSGDMRVLATTGDSWLGGDDFDIAIADAAANIFWKSHGADLRQRAVEWQYLIMACERAKRDLSRTERTQVVVPEVLRNAQGMIDLRINLARNKVEELWQEPIRRSIDTCNQALSLAGVPKSKLSAIFLSGGTSYIPAIKRSLIERFKVPVHLGLAPEHAVCAGAGVRAAILEGTTGLSPVSRKKKR